LAAPPLILFGAIDRHNLGDILLARVAEAETTRQAPSRPILLAGLAAHAAAPGDGPPVRAIADLARAWGDAPADVLHVGGELLTCGLFQAAVMLQSPAEADAAIARYADDAAAGLDWARRVTKLDQGLGYLVPKALFRNPGRFEYRAVGGVDLAGLDPALRAEALARLREAATLSVRDRVTRESLAAAGIDAALEPDPVSRVPALFAERIRAHAGSGEPAAVSEAFPHGYLAVQFAAEYGDDASLDSLAGFLDTRLYGTGLGLVLFRAGAAPWHDDLEVYRRLADRLGKRDVRLFRSLDVWDICTLLSRARAYCGSSLHGWILSRAFAVDVLDFPLPARNAKLAAYRDTWG
jgi:hypothetical protein